MTEIEFIENTNPKPVSEGFADYMYVSEFENEDWHTAKILPYGEYPQTVQSTGLRYKLCVYETVRIVLDKDDKLCLFRADAHIAELWDKADKKGLPLFEHDQLMYVLKELVKLNRSFLNKDNVMFATIMINAADSGVGIQTVTKALLTITLETKPKEDMRRLDATADRLRLDEVYKRYAVSVDGYDLFFRMNDKIITSADGGVTKDTVLRLIGEWGIEIEHGYVSMDEAVKSHGKGQLAEVFCTDARGIIVSITSLQYKDKTLDVPIGKLSRKLFDSITHAEQGTFPAYPDWTVRI